MTEPIRSYWEKRLLDVKENLEKNHFEVYPAADLTEARRIFLEEILPLTGARRISWGGSMTLTASGICDALRGRSEIETLDTFDKTLSPEDYQERRRQALLVDLFLTGTNALVQEGHLVNLDMTGNRVAALTFGPRHVVVLVGRNKIVSDLDEAFWRVKNYAAPTNAMRLAKKTPCAKTSFCEDCKSPDRICNTWTITEKSFPKGRIKILLINEDLGL